MTPLWQHPTFLLPDSRVQPAALPLSPCRALQLVLKAPPPDGLGLLQAGPRGSRQGDLDLSTSPQPEGARAQAFLPREGSTPTTDPRPEAAARRRRERSTGLGRRAGLGLSTARDFTCLRSASCSRKCDPSALPIFLGEEG